MNAKISQLLLITILFFAVTPFCVKGQELIALSRYNDNFKLLVNDSAHRYTIFPELKSIYLLKTVPVDLSFGGEVREQFLYFAHENWDASLAGNQTIRSDKPFLLQRYMFHTNLVVTPYVRIFAELKSGLENGRTTGPRPQVDLDRLDFNQLFADVNIFPGSSNTLTIRAGRQELDYGASRLISENEGPNVRLAFQGLKLMYGSQSFKMDAFYTRPINNSPDSFDDTADKTKKLYGVYATVLLPENLNLFLDVYLIGNKNENAFYFKGKGPENRQSYGLRLYSAKRTTITYDLEGIYQTGTFAEQNIRSFGLVARLNYNFQVNNLLQTISLVGQTASGDGGDSHTLGTFNPLYTRVYYGLGSPFWPSNILQVTPSVNLSIAPKLLFGADTHFLWRENINDGLYFVVPTRSAFIYNTAIPSNKRYIGAQQDLSLTYNLTRYWYIDAEFTYMPTTAYIAETGYGKNIVFMMLQTKLRF